MGFDELFVFVPAMWGRRAIASVAERKAASLITMPSLKSLTSRLPQITDIGLRQGLNYIRPASNMIWGNKYARTFIVFTGAEVVAGQVYGLVPGLKSPAYNAFADNNGIISDRMNKIRREEHLLSPGKYNDEMFTGLLEAFPYGLATPKGIEDYFKNKNIKTNSQVIAYADEIISLNVQNQNLAGNFNWYEKRSASLAGLSDSLFTPISKGLNNAGVPFAGAFIKNSVGSFNPLTGFSIGMNAGANPSKSWRGFADYVVNPLEAGIGLRRGSIVDLSWEYDSGYRNLGEAAGSLFILRGGGGEALRGAKSAKTQLGSFSLSSTYAKYKAPATIAVVTLPLAVAAWSEGWQSGNLRTPFGATLVMGANMFGVPLNYGRIRPNNADNLDMPALNFRGTIEKTDNMNIALGVLENTARKEGKNIFIDEHNQPRTLHIGGSIPASSVSSGLKSYEGAEFLVTKQLFEAKVGEPVVLIPVITMPASSINQQDQDKEVLSRYIKDLLNFQKIREMRKENKIINTAVLKENNFNLKDYSQYKKEYRQWDRKFKAMGGNFNNFIDSLDVSNSNRAGALEIEAKGFQVVAAINKLEKREVLPEHLKPFEAFASLHIENNKIRESIGQPHLEYDPLSIGLGWKGIEDFVADKNNKPSKAIYDLGCAGGKTEEMAIVMRYLSEAYPEEKLIYQTTDKKLVEEFRKKPILWGARVNEVEAGAILDKGTPFKAGVNIFDTHTLLELTSRGYLKDRHLFTDEPQSGMQMADLVKSVPGLLEDLSPQERAKNALVHNSLKGLLEITRRVISRELGRKVSLEELENNEVTALLLEKGIIITGEYRKVFFAPAVQEKIMREYRGIKTLDGFSTPEVSGRFYDYGKDLDSVVGTFAEKLVGKEAKDYYIYKEGEYCIGEGFTGAQRPKTHFGGGEGGVLNNLQAQVTAIKHGWSLLSFEKILLDKTIHAANYIQALEQARGVTGFSGTGKAYEQSSAGLNIPVIQIGKNYDSSVRAKTNVPIEVKGNGKEEATEYYYQQTLTGETKKIEVASKNGHSYPKTISIAKTLKDASVSLPIASSNDAKELTKADKELRNLQKQSVLDESNFIQDASDKLIFEANKRVLPKEIEISLITYNAVGKIKNISELSDYLKEKFAEMLLTDQTLSFKTKAEALEFIARNPKAMDKLKEYGADLDLMNYQQEYVKFCENRKKNPSRKRILLMQGLIEGSNVAAKIAGDNSQGKIFLFGLQPDANVLQAGQRLGIIPSVARRRMEGEYTWLVPLDDPLLTTRERRGLANAKTEAEIRGILFQASQRLQSEINAQNLAKIGRIKLSSSEAQRNLSRVNLRLSWERLKTAPSSMFIAGNPFLEQMAEENKAKISKKWAISDLGVFNNEGAALLNLTQKLSNLSADERNALRNLGFPLINEGITPESKLPLNQVFEIAEFLYQNELINFSVDYRNNGIITEGLPKLIFVGNLLNSFGITKVTSEEIINLLNSANSDFGLYNLISQKLQESNPALYQFMNKEIAPIIEAQKEKGEIKKEYQLNKIQPFLKLDKMPGVLNMGQAKKAGLIANISALFISNLYEFSDRQLEVFTAISEFLVEEAPKYKIDRFSVSFGEIMKLLNNELTVFDFISNHSDDANIKLYAQRLALCQEIQKKYFGQSRNILEAEKLKLDKDIELFKKFGADLTRNTGLNLEELRTLADNKLADELLLRMYIGFDASGAEIKEIIQEESDIASISKWQQAQPPAQFLVNELRKRRRISGLEKAVSQLRESGYSSEEITEAIKLLEHSDSFSQQAASGVPIEPLRTLSPVHLPEQSVSTVVDAATTRVNNLAVEIADQYL